LRISKIKNDFQRSIINTGCYFFDLLFVVFISQSRKTYAKKKVLIIRPDAIGDFIIWSDSARAYRTIYPKPDYELYLLGNPACEILALNSGNFDYFIPFDRIKFILNWVYRFKKWQELFSIQFETLIYPSYSREFSTGDLLLKNLAAKTKIGIVSDNAIDSVFWTNMGSIYYTQLFNIQKSDKHELIKNEAFIRKLGMEQFEASIPDLAFVKNIVNNNTNKTLSFDQLEGTKYFVISPGARVGLRQWPAINFTYISEYLAKKTGWKGIVLGSPNEVELCNTIVSSAQSSMLNLAGKTDLIEMIKIIGNAQFFVGNETAGIHIAIAQKTPSICLLGGGHFGRFMPYPSLLLEKKSIHSTSIFNQLPCFNCDWNCIYTSDKLATVPCIKEINLETVKLQIDQLLSKTYPEMKLN
jgi:ADP-heptose:LPS heptosyltransferase